MIATQAITHHRADGHHRFTNGAYFTISFAGAIPIIERGVATIDPHIPAFGSPHFNGDFTEIFVRYSVL
jgi:hypothetical protein